MIPTYTFDGARLRDYSIESIEWLLEMDSITVRRKHGRIVSARFRAQTRKYTPCRATALAHWRATHLEAVAGFPNLKIVVHNPLPWEEAQRERERRLALAAERKFDGRRKAVSNLPVELAA